MLGTIKSELFKFPNDYRGNNNKTKNNYDARQASRISRRLRSRAVEWWRNCCEPLLAAADVSVIYRNTIIL